MMAGPFLIGTLAIVSIFFKKRILAITLLLLAVALCWILLGYHATDVLYINW